MRIIDDAEIRQLLFIAGMISNLVIDTMGHATSVSDPSDIFM